MSAPKRKKPSSKTKLEQQEREASGSKKKAINGNGEDSKTTDASKSKLVNGVPKRPPRKKKPKTESETKETNNTTTEEDRSNTSMDSPITANDTDAISNSKEGAALAELKQKILANLLGRELKEFKENIDSLIELKAELSYKEGKDGFTLLHRCIIQGGTTEILQILLENGANVNSTDNNGRTPLHHAAQMGNLEFCKLLLESKAKTDAQDCEKQTPLHKAVRYNHEGVIDLYQQYEGQIDIQDNNGSTALHIAVKNDFRNCIKQLVKAGADVNIKDKYNQIPQRLIALDNPDAKSIVKILKGSQKRVRRSSSSKLQKLDKTTSARLPKSNRKGKDEMSQNSNFANASSMQQSMSASTTHSKGLPKNASAIPATARRSNSDRAMKSNVQVRSYSVTHTTKAQVRAMDKYGFCKGGPHSAKATTSKDSKTERKRDTERTMKCLKMIKQWNELEAKTPDKIIKFCDKGVPNSMRGEVWRRLAHIDHVRVTIGEKYDDLCTAAIEDAVDEQIHKDLPRTMPTHYLFTELDGRGQRSLNNVLRAYAAYNPGVGYCQGMGFITAMALIYMPEEDAFWFLLTLAEEYGFSGVWAPDLPAIPKIMYICTKLMESHLPKVFAHLTSIMGPDFAALYTPQFFMTGFMSCLDFGIGLRIWDSFLGRKSIDFLYSVVLGIFKLHSDFLLKTTDMDAIMTFLKFSNNRDVVDQVEFDADYLIKLAISFKIRDEELRLLEGEYHHFAQAKEQANQREKRKREKEAERRRLKLEKEKAEKEAAEAKAKAEAEAKEKAEAEEKEKAEKAAKANQQEHDDNDNSESSVASDTTLHKKKRKKKKRVNGATENGETKSTHHKKRKKHSTTSKSNNNSSSSSSSSNDSTAIANGNET